MFSWQDLDLNQPINWAHPLNRGRLAWWLTVPQRYGAPTWWDLVDGYAGTLTSFGAGYGWNSASNKGGAGSLRFDGSSAYVNGGTATQPIQSGQVTVAAWVYASSLNGAGTNAIVSLRKSGSGSGWLLACANAKPEFGVSVNGSVLVFAASSLSLSTAVWHWVVGTFDGTNIRIYVDANVQKTAAASGSVVYPSPATLEFGGDSGTAGRLWNGYLNDVSIWNRALSQTEITALFDLSQQGYPDVLNWDAWDVLRLAAAAAPSVLIPSPLVYRPRFHPAFYE